MHRTTLRLDELAYDFIARQAQRAGVSTAQYIREAAIARAFYELAQEEGEHKAEKALQKVLKALRE